MSWIHWTTYSSIHHLVKWHTHHLHSILKFCGSSPFPFTNPLDQSSSIPFRELSYSSSSRSSLTAVFQHSFPGIILLFPFQSSLTIVKTRDHPIHTVGHAGNYDIISKQLSINTPSEIWEARAILKQCLRCSVDIWWMGSYSYLHISWVWQTGNLFDEGGKLKTCLIGSAIPSVLVHGSCGQHGTQEPSPKLCLTANHDLDYSGLSGSFWVVADEG